MTSEQAEKLIKKALSDKKFLGELLANPERAAGSLGVTLSAEEAKTLRAMKEDEFVSFAKEYSSATDPAKRRAAC